MGTHVIRKLLILPATLFVGYLLLYVFLVNNTEVEDIEQRLEQIAVSVKKLQVQSLNKEHFVTLFADNSRGATDENKEILSASNNEQEMKKLLTLFTFKQKDIHIQNPETNVVANDASLQISNQDEERAVGSLDSTAKIADLSNSQNFATTNNVEELLVNTADKLRERRRNCSAFIHGNSTALLIAYSLPVRITPRISRLNNHLNHNVSDCEGFIQDVGFINHFLTEEERDFPIAFSILTYTDIEMLVRLLAAVYRPQNFYCIHVDAKTNARFFSSVKAVAGCFDNVQVLEERLNVRWGNWTIVEAEISCMKVLHRHRKWKYFINLTGQEFPLKTNLELVRVLKAFHGANDVEGILKAHTKSFRWANSPVPPGITPVKGATHIVVNRDFVTFILYNQTSQAMQKWLRRTWVPDETFFATLNHNPHLGIRGSYTDLNRTEKEMGRKPYFNRYKIWAGEGPCAGYFLREVCVLSIGDLKRMTTSTRLIANKFHLGKDRLVISCLEEWLADKTLRLYTGTQTFDTSVYENSVIVKHQIT